MSHTPQLSGVAARIKKVESQNQANKNTKNSFTVIGNDSLSAKTEFAKRRAAILKSMDSNTDESKPHTIIKKSEHTGDFSKKKNDMAKFFENQGVTKSKGSNSSMISLDKDDPNYDKFSKYTTMQKFQIKESDIRQKMIMDALTNDEIESFFVSNPSSPMSSLDNSVSSSTSSSTVDKMLKYEKMRKMGTPEPAIRQKMIAEGIDKNEIETFFAASPLTTSSTLIQKDSPKSSMQMSKMIMAQSQKRQSNDVANISSSSSSNPDIVDETGLFEKYIKMKKMRLPDGPIRQKMLSDGLKDKDISLFFDSLANGKHIIQFPNTTASKRSSIKITNAVADLNKKVDDKEKDDKPKSINTSSTLAASTSTITTTSTTVTPAAVSVSVVKRLSVIKPSVADSSISSSSSISASTSKTTPTAATITATTPQPPVKPVKPVVIPIPSPRPITAINTPAVVHPLKSTVQATIKPVHKPADFSAVPVNINMSNNTNASSKQSLWEAQTDQPALMLWEQLRDLRLARVAKMNAAKAVPLWETPPLAIYPSATDNPPSASSTANMTASIASSGVITQHQSDEEEEEEEEETDEEDDDDETGAAVVDGDNNNQPNKSTAALTTVDKQDVVIQPSIKTSVLITALNAKTKMKKSSTTDTTTVSSSKSKKRKLAKKRVHQEPFTDNYLQFRTLQAEMAHLLQDVDGESSSDINNITTNTTITTNDDNNTNNNNEMIDNHATNTTTKDTLIENPHFATYKKMRKMNMPELAIRQKMIFDGIPPMIVDEFMKMPLKLIVVPSPSPLMQRIPSSLNKRTGGGNGDGDDSGDDVAARSTDEKRRQTEVEDYRDRMSIRPFSFQAIFGELAGAFAVIEDEDDELYRASILKESLLQTSPPALRRIHLSNLGKAYVKNNSLRKRATFSIDPRTGLMIPSVVERNSIEKSNYYLTHNNNNGNNNGNNNTADNVHKLRSTKNSTMTNNTTSSRLHSFSTSSFVNENPIYSDKNSSTSTDYETDTDPDSLNSARSSPRLLSGGNSNKRGNSKGSLSGGEDLSMAPVDKNSGCTIS